MHCVKIYKHKIFYFDNFPIFCSINSVASITFTMLYYHPTTTKLPLWQHHFTFPPAMYRVLVSPHICQHFDILIGAISDVKKYPMVSVCISNDWWFLSVFSCVYLATCIVPLENWLFRPFVHYLILFFAFIIRL